MSNPQFKITNGPSKFLLMMALFAEEGVEVAPLTFTVVPSHSGPPTKAEKDGTAKRARKMRVYIRGVRLEDGSGHSFIITGQLAFDQEKPFDDYLHTMAYIYFDSRKREGYCEVDETRNLLPLREVRKKRQS